MFRVRLNTIPGAAPRTYDGTTLFHTFAPCLPPSTAKRDRLIPQIFTGSRLCIRCQLAICHLLCTVHTATFF